jgi:hypothetical protein
MDTTCTAFGRRRRAAGSGGADGQAGAWVDVRRRRFPWIRLGLCCLAAWRLSGLAAELLCPLPPPPSAAVSFRGNPWTYPSKFTRDPAITRIGSLSASLSRAAYEGLGRGGRLGLHWMDGNGCR